MAVVFGWPAIVLSLLAFGIAFGEKRSSLGFVGLILASPFLWYASQAPSGLWFSPLMFIALTGAAILLRQGRRLWAAACLAPFVVVVAMLAVYVGSQR